MNFFSMAEIPTDFIFLSKPWESPSSSSISSVGYLHGIYDGIESSSDESFIHGPRQFNQLRCSQAQKQIKEEENPRSPCHY